MYEIKIPDGCKSIKIDQESDNRIVITFEPKKQEWVPKFGDNYYIIAYDFNSNLFIFEKRENRGAFVISKIVKKTEQEAQLLCDKLNAAIN